MKHSELPAVIDPNDFEIIPEQRRSLPGTAQRYDNGGPVTRKRMICDHPDMFRLKQERATASAGMISRRLVAAVDLANYDHIARRWLDVSEDVRSAWRRYYPGFFEDVSRPMEAAAVTPGHAGEYDSELPEGDGFNPFVYDD